MGVKATTRNRVFAGLVVVAGVGLGAAAFLRAKTAPPPTTSAAPAAVEPPPAPSAPAPRPPGPVPSRSTTAPPPAGSEASASLSESVLMARLRNVAGSNFPLAVELAHAGNKRFPDSPNAPERASILIHALAAEGLGRDARAEAEYAVNHYPDSSWVEEIERFTGAHRHRNLILTDGGVIQAR
jgi:hypothetical protein